MKFMLDHNLAPGLARALNELNRREGHEVIALREKFPQESKDEHWLAHLAREGGWAVISADGAVFESKAAVAAWKETKLTMFFLAPGWNNLTYWIKAEKFIHAWPAILSAATTVKSGTLYNVHVGGKLEVLSAP